MRVLKEMPISVIRFQSKHQYCQRTAHPPIHHGPRHFHQKQGGSKEGRNPQNLVVGHDLGVFLSKKQLKKHVVGKVHGKEPGKEQKPDVEFKNHTDMGV